MNTNERSIVMNNTNHMPEITEKKRIKNGTIVSKKYTDFSEYQKTALQDIIVP